MEMVGWLVRWFVHLVNSMPFNALFILIAGCQPTLWTTKTPILFSFAWRNAFALTVHAVHWILSNITYITDWVRSSLRIGSWVSFIILTFCVYLLFFVVILESWHCYLRTHSHTLGQENGQNKCTRTRTHSHSQPIHWFTRISCSTAFGISNRMTTKTRRKHTDSSSG